MAEETFSQIGRTEAVRQLFEGTGYSPDGHCTLRVAKGTGSVVNSTVMMTEGIDFDLRPHLFSAQAFGIQSCNHGDR